ncbi:MAG: hypothetical protein U1D55_14875 [Phycisphaerae bacterium]
MSATDLPPDSRLTEVERLLASLSIRELPATREARLLAALTAASAYASPPRWWSRRIPVWQALAACAVILAAALLLPRQRDSAADRPQAPASALPSRPDSSREIVVVRVDAPLFSESRSPEALDLSRWRALP